MQRKIVVLAALLAIAVATLMTYGVVYAATDFSARRHYSIDANGNAGCYVHSNKTHARARVGCANVAKFQAYIDDLEANHGAMVYDLGGIRPGHCSAGHQHPCGKALDVCQLRRGVVSGRCHLPGRAQLASIASSHGLFEGGRWCNSDYGHVQVDVSAAACGDGGTVLAQRHHHRYARVLSARRRYHVRQAYAMVTPQPVPMWNRP